MHKFYKISSIALLASLALTGCVNLSPESSNQTQTQTSETASISTVAPFLTEFYSSLLIERSSEASENSVKINEKLESIMSVGEYKSFTEAYGAPLEAFSSFDPEKQTEVADVIQDLNPSAEFYDFSNISDDKRAFLNMYSIGISTFSASYDPGDLDLKASVSDSDVLLEGNKASVENKDVTIAVSEDNSTQLDLLVGVPTTHMIFVDGKWKLDAEASVNDLTGIMEETDQAPIE